MFDMMKESFDRNGDVFKKTTNAAQLLRQGEIDVVGVDQDGEIHALEVAFHEGGLSYTGGSGNRVLKKLLRTMLILNAYHPAGTKLHISFASPKVRPAIQNPLQDIFENLEIKYPEIEWNLIVNDDFTYRIVMPTLQKAGTVADTSELLVRAVKLLDLTGARQTQAMRSTPEYPRKAPEASRSLRASQTMDRGGDTRLDRIQPVVRNLMATLFEDWPTLLDNADIRNLMDRDYCKNTLGLQLGGFAMLRRMETGRMINGYSRYWNELYAGRFYVCSQWGKDYHRSNAESLLKFVIGLSERNPNHQGLPALDRHKRELRGYIG